MLSVQTTNTEAFIAVGSNVDPLIQIPEALRLLAQRVTIIAISTFYQTKAIARPEQPDYRNGMFKIQVEMSPMDLKMNVLRDIEHKLGRIRTSDPLAARTIDLDVVLFGDLDIDEEGLRLPAPDVRERPFVAVPLLELAPDLIMPDTQEPLASLQSARGGASLMPDKTLSQTLKERIHT